MSRGLKADRAHAPSYALLLAAFLVACMPDRASADECSLVDKVSGKTFSVFQIMGYRNIPDLGALCVERLKIWYAREFWPDGVPRKDDFDLGLPDRDRVERVGMRSPEFGGITVLDIEHWPLEDRTFADAAVDNYLTVLDWFRKSAPPEQAVGYYSMVPIRDYWRALRGVDHPKYQDWQEENDRLVRMAEAVDILFPSIYTFYEDQEGWLTYAKAQIEESRRIAPDKPIYAFVWPEYHPSNDARAGDPIEPEYWRVQLDFLREHADGVVIWTIDDTKAVDFEDIPPWWDATVQFIEEGYDCQGCPAPGEG
ncbi:MAG: hypothetical protein AAGC99_03015 [Pseudomonadota bacterium]